MQGYIYVTVWDSKPFFFFRNTYKSYQVSNLCTTESNRMFPAKEMIRNSCILYIFLVGSEVGGGGRAVVQGPPVVL